MKRYEKFLTFAIAGLIVAVCMMVLAQPVHAQQGPYSCNQGGTGQNKWIACGQCVSFECDFNQGSGCYWDVQKQSDIQREECGRSPDDCRGDSGPGCGADCLYGCGDCHGADYGPGCTQESSAPVLVDWRLSNSSAAMKMKARGYRVGIRFPIADRTEGAWIMYSHLQARAVVPGSNTLDACESDQACEDAIDPFCQRSQLGGVLAGTGNVTVQATGDKLCEADCRDGGSGMVLCVADDGEGDVP